MPTIRHTLAALSATLLTLVGVLAGAPAALARTPVDPTNAPPPPVITPVATAAAGSPVWAFVLVAAAAVLLTVAVMLTARTVHTPRTHTRRA